MDSARRLDVRPSGLPSHERQFYAQDRAFGRFGMRVFSPAVMEAAHWHGHVEVNLCRAAAILYDVNDRKVAVPPGRSICFWAGVPHQLLEVNPTGSGVPVLSNIYLPLDSFLMMPHIGRLQVALLSGGIVELPDEMCGAAVVGRWFADYRTGSFERVEVVKMELNAMFRRLLLEPLGYLLAPEIDLDSERSLSSTHIGHAIEMVRFILENLDKPLKNADIAAITSLHENYAIALFSRIMRIPPRRFLVRMRLMRARALLVESSMAIPSVAETSGFNSISQFYHRFREAYGVTPAELRSRYVRMAILGSAVFGVAISAAPAGVRGQAVRAWRPESDAAIWPSGSGDDAAVSARNPSHQAFVCRTSSSSQDRKRITFGVVDFDRRTSRPCPRTGIAVSGNSTMSLPVRSSCSARSMLSRQIPSPSTAAQIAMNERSKRGPRSSSNATLRLRRFQSRHPRIVTSPWIRVCPAMSAGRRIGRRPWARRGEHIGTMTSSGKGTRIEPAGAGPGL